MNSRGHHFLNTHRIFLIETTKKSYKKVNQKNQQTKEANGLLILPENSSKRNINQRRRKTTFLHALFSRIYQSSYQQMHNLLFLIMIISLDSSIRYLKKDISEFQILILWNLLNTLF